MSTNRAGLSPQEHDEVRATMVAGLEKLRRSRHRRGQFVAAGVALVMVGGATSGTLSLFGLLPTTQAPPPAATPTAEAPDPCLTYENAALETIPEGAALAAAIRAADLPAGYVMSPGISVAEVPAAEGAGLEAVVRVCGDPVSSTELKEIGDGLAASIAAHPASDDLTTLIVEPWSRVSSDAISADPQRPAIRTDFQEHDWSNPAAPPVDAWE
jgi:hypothetical protein